MNGDTHSRPYMHFLKHFPACNGLFLCLYGKCFSILKNNRKKACKMCAITLKEYQKKQLVNIENWVKKQKTPYELSTIENYWKELSINYATITSGKNGKICEVLILNCEYEGLYTPAGVFEMWERIEHYLRCRALPNLKTELRGHNQSMWIYFD